MPSSPLAINNHKAITQTRPQRSLSPSQISHWTRIVPMVEVKTLCISEEGPVITLLLLVPSSAHDQTIKKGGGDQKIANGMLFGKFLALIREALFKLRIRNNP